MQGASLGRVSFASNTGEFWREHIILPFFEQYLKGSGDAKLPEAYMFETGTNVWRQFAEWPPKQAQAKQLYFHADGKLSFEPPTAMQASFDEYVSDPAHPVPFVPYTSVNRTEQEYMVADQRTFARRPDVLVYQTEPLDEDVTIAGPISAKLRVSTSGTDSDFVVKLIDVFPNDYPEPDATNAPRPLDQADTAALKQWREDRQKIEKFYVECDSLWKNARALAETLTETAPAEWAVMQEAADKLKNWIDYYEGLAKKESDPASKQENLSSVAECKAIVALLHRLGIDPNPPNPAVPAGQGGLKSLLR